MSNQEVARFYDYTFEDEGIQQQLLETQGLDGFMNKVLEIASQRGFEFTRGELESTFDGMGERSTFDHIDFGSKWVSKIMSLGWVPKGYTR